MASGRTPSKHPPAFIASRKKSAQVLLRGVFSKNVAIQASTGTGISTEDNLILTRILRLEGLEEGINKGAGVDSYERCIYIHGTNREDLVGTPLSHGCLALEIRTSCDLFEMVSEGTLVYIDPPPIVIGEKPLPECPFYRYFRHRYERPRAISAFSGDRRFRFRPFARQ